MRTIAWLACLGTVLVGLQSANGSIIFVDSQAGTCGDGQTWATAYRHLQDALSAARDSGGTITEIWVAAGTYKPDRNCANPAGSGDRTATFQLVDGVALRGGFAGNEDPASFDLADRDFETNTTVLSGDLAGNDGPDFANNSENSCNVVKAVGVGAATILDGFTISGGNVPDEGHWNGGAGMQMTDSSAGLINCTFENNHSYYVGGGLWASIGSPTLIGCKFVNNRVYWDGRGAFFSEGGSPVLINCFFAGHQDRHNAELAADWFFSPPGPSISLVNCTVINNSVDRGQAIYIGSSSNLSAVNCIIRGTYPIAGYTTSVSVTYSCVQGGWDGVGNIDVDPKLLPDGSLDPTSPCIDVGNNSAVPAGITRDLGGNPRFVDDPFIPDSAGAEQPAVDMGAYEFQGTARRVLYVKAAAAPGGDGLSWTSAYQYLQDALEDVSFQGDTDTNTEIWIAPGVYQPDRRSWVPYGSGARNEVFDLPDRVALYGGFPGEAGQEDMFHARNPRLYSTVLSGDLAGNDGPDFENNSDNAFCVLKAQEVSAIISGCVISGGNANSGYQDFASGIRNIEGNLTCTDCVFQGNFSLGNGGAVYGVYAKASFRRCVFANNSAKHGGAVYSAQTNLTIADCSFHHNAAPSGIGGAVAVSSGANSIRSSTFFGNTAQNAGGVYGSGALLTNCILWGNSAGTNPQIGGTAPNVTYSCIQGGYTGQGNISTDPLFVDAAGGDLRLQAGSPCIDAGKNSAVTTMTDLLGLPRFIDHVATPDCRWAPGTCGTAPIVDMGAHEFAIIPGDFDDDYDVDGDDLDAFIACAAGPGLLYGPGCEAGDLNADQQVDSTDFGIFQRCLSGAGRVANPACAD